MSVSDGEPAEDAATGDGRVNDGHHLVQLGLEGGVEVLRSADGHQAVRVGQLREDADLIVVLKVGANHAHGDDVLYFGGQVKVNLNFILC